MQIIFITVTVSFTNIVSQIIGSNNSTVQCNGTLTSRCRIDRLPPVPPVRVYTHPSARMNDHLVSVVYINSLWQSKRWCWVSFLRKSLWVYYLKHGERTKGPTVLLIIIQFVIASGELYLNWKSAYYRGPRRPINTQSHLLCSLKYVRNYQRSKHK